MKLTALDQVHISSVKREVISAGETFEVSDDMGKQLMAKNPALFQQAEAEKPAKAKKAEAEAEADDDGAGEKAEPAPQNKAEDAPANKAETRRNLKGK